MQETRDAFAKDKAAKSFGTDSVSIYFLKLALHLIENSLAFLFNTSTETCLFLESRKATSVTPNYFWSYKEGARMISRTIATNQSYLKNS